MTLDEFRQEMRAYLKHVGREQTELRYSIHALVRMESLYRRFDAEEWGMADQVIAEWLSSDDSSERYHAWVLTRNFRIIAALPALETRAAHLASSRERGASDELEAINHLSNIAPTANSSRSGNRPRRLAPQLGEAAWRETLIVNARIRWPTLSASLWHSRTAIGARQIRFDSSAPWSLSEG